MNVSVTITRPPSVAFGEVTDDKRRMVAAAVRKVGLAAQTALRQQVTSSLRNSRGVANAWRIKFFPTDKPSLGATALIYSKAPNIIRAFDSGEVIQAKDGGYLCIPLPAAGDRNIGNKRITPRTWMARTGRKLAFVEAPNGTTLLVARPLRAEVGAKSEPIFLLMRQVTPGKRLDVDAVAKQSQTALFAELQAGLR